MTEFAVRSRGLTLLAHAFRPDPFRSPARRSAMNDLILTARIESLKSNLTRLLQPLLWRKTFEKLHLAEQVWLTLATNIKAEASKLLDKVEKISALQDVGNAWSCYRKTLSESQPIFRESLELLGGL